MKNLSKINFESGNAVGGSLAIKQWVLAAVESVTADI